ncbi:MAG TPA: ABC transporter permease [Chloroflexota bacterium]|nr:ABC transporter permease [Chloroflexota bacterium]
MGRYVLRRLLQAIPVVFFSTFLVFMVIHLIPGDAAAVLAGPNATAESLAAIRTEMGLDQPLLVQYGVWVGHLLQGDLGRSTLSGQPILKLLQARAPATIELTIAAMLISMAIALPLGILSATHVRGRLEWLISTIQSLCLAVPNFWGGILAIILFSLVLRWLPPGGRVADGNDLGNSIKSLILPATTLALYLAAGLSRFIKFNLLEVFFDDFVRTARAKGLDNTTVVYRHALRNAMLPVITILGVQFASLLGGTVIIEAVFSWPGVGGLMLDGISNRDYAVVQGGLLLLVLLFIVINLLVDLTYALIDPRLRVGDT